MKKLNCSQIGILIIGLVAAITCQAQNGLMLTTVAPCPDGDGVPGSGASLVQESDGTLYGAFSRGDTDGGEVFRLALNGSLTTIAAFYGTNGMEPFAPILAPDGYFYGITQEGGSDFDAAENNAAYGTVYRMDSNGNLTTLLSFEQTNGWSPRCLILGSDGSFYGTTDGGGTNNNGVGTIFKITTNGDFTLLASFNGTNGSDPMSLIQASDGNFYGTAGFGGAGGSGTVFKMTPNGQITNLVSFYGTNGSLPIYLMQASDGCLYGITAEGGLYNTPPYWMQTDVGDGVVFKVTTNGDFSDLVMFNGTNGADPSTLTEVSNGVFYCATDLAYSSRGELLQVTTNGDLTQLLSFGAGTTSPYAPIGPLTKASDGNYYGYAQQPQPGVIYSIRPIQAPVLQPLMQGSQLNLNWNAWLGYSYNVMYETNLGCSNWTLLSTVTPQTNGPASCSDTIGPDTQRFYEVILQLP